jgi:hypothetical protein
LRATSRNCPPSAPEMAMILKEALAGRVDLVITDLVMPGARSFLRKALEDGGYEVMEASSSATTMRAGRSAAISTSRTFRANWSGPNGFWMNSASFRRTP